MYWIQYRDLAMKDQVLFETDDIQTATLLLQSVADSDFTELIDFCGDLNGALDFVLYGVKLFSDAPAKAA